MADRETIFILGDDDNEYTEYGQGGFEDAPDTEEPKQDDEQQPAAADGTIDRNQFFAAMAAQREQISGLIDQNKQLQERLLAKEQPAQPRPEKPQFTRDQWEEDPQGCNEAMNEYYREDAAYQQTTEQQQQQAAQATDAANIRAQHQKDWNEEVADAPYLMHPQIAGRVNQIMHENGFTARGDGIIRAVRQLRMEAKHRGIDLNQFSNQQQPANPPQSQSAQQQPAAQPQQGTPPRPEQYTDTAAAEQRGAAQEQARQRRVRQSAMHGSGRGGGQQKVQLTQEQLQACERLGCKPETFIETMSAFGGGA